MKPAPKHFSGRTFCIACMEPVGNGDVRRTAAWHAPAAAAHRCRHQWPGLSTSCLIRRLSIYATRAAHLGKQESRLHKPPTSPTFSHVVSCRAGAPSTHCRLAVAACSAGCSPLQLICQHQRRRRWTDARAGCMQAVHVPASYYSRRDPVRSYIICGCRKYDISSPPLCAPGCFKSRSPACVFSLPSAISWL